MAFAISAHTLPRITCFKDVDDLFKDRHSRLTKRQLAGGRWSDTEVPLVKARDESKRIVWHAGSLEPFYSLRYHHTDVVSYYPDGRMCFNISYDSRSTCVFFEEMSPYGWRIQRLRKKLFYVHRWPSGLEEFHHGDRTTPLEVAADSTVLNPEPFTFTRKVSDKERRRELRATIEPFMEWFMALSNVGNSLAAVMAGAEQTEIAHNTKRLYVSYALETELVKELIAGGQDEYRWRQLCVQLRGHSLYRRAHWEEMAHEVKYGLERRPSMVDVLEKRMWELAGGWRCEEVTVPAGEKP